MVDFLPARRFALAWKCFTLSGLNKGLPGGLVRPILPGLQERCAPCFGYKKFLYTNNVRATKASIESLVSIPWTAGRLYVVSTEKKIRESGTGPMRDWTEVTLISHRATKKPYRWVLTQNATHPQMAILWNPEGTDHWLYGVLRSPWRTHYIHLRRYWKQLQRTLRLTTLKSLRELLRRSHARRPSAWDV